MIHMHRWTPLYTTITARRSKRNSELDSIYVSGEVEVCERCKPSKYRLRPAAPLLPVELEDVGDLLSRTERK